MPLRNGTVGFTRLRLQEPLTLTQAELRQTLEVHDFTPINPEGTVETSVGWTEVPETGMLLGDLAGSMTLVARVETLKVPATHVKAYAKERQHKLEAEHQVPLSKGSLKDLRELAKRELRKRVFPRTQKIDLIFENDPKQLLVIGASKSLLERLQALWIPTFAVPIDVETAGSLAERLLAGPALLRNLVPEPAFRCDTVIRDADATEATADADDGDGDPLDDVEDVDANNAAEVENVLEDRRFLGREFLTWLACKASAEDGFRSRSGWRVLLGDSARLTAFGTGGLQEVRTRSANLAGMSDLRFAVGGGLLPRELSLIMEHSDRLWALSLLADGLGAKQVKLPTLLSEEEAEGADERAQNLLDLSEAILTVYEEFLRRRTSPKTWSDEVAEIQTWVRDAVKHD